MKGVGRNLLSEFGPGGTAEPGFRRVGSLCHKGRRDITVFAVGNDAEPVLGNAGDSHGGSVIQLIENLRRHGGGFPQAYTGTGDIAVFDLIGGGGVIPGGDAAVQGSVGFRSAVGAELFDEIGKDIPVDMLRGEGDRHPFPGDPGDGDLCTLVIGPDNGVGRAGTGTEPNGVAGHLAELQTRRGGGVGFGSGISRGKHAACLRLIPDSLRGRGLDGCDHLPGHGLGQRLRFTDGEECLRQLGGLRRGDGFDHKTGFCDRDERAGHVGAGRRMISRCQIGCGGGGRQNEGTIRMDCAVRGHVDKLILGKRLSRRAYAGLLNDENRGTAGAGRAGDAAVLCDGQKLGRDITAPSVPADLIPIGI